MPLFDWDAPLPDERRDGLIDQLATIVARRGLQTPATLFLETHKPLAYLASQSLLLASGFLAPLFGPLRVQEYVKLLEARENIDLLIGRIEELSDGTRKLGGPAAGDVDKRDYCVHHPDCPAPQPLHP